MLFQLATDIICYTAGLLYPAYASYKCLSAADALELERDTGPTDDASWISWAGSFVARRNRQANTDASSANTTMGAGNSTMMTGADTTTDSVATTATPTDPLVLIHQEQSRWITYWCVFAVWHSIDWIIEGFMFWLPFYYPAKIVFTLWLVMPQSNGATIVYRYLLEPFLVANESNIDATIARIRSQMGDMILQWLRSGLLAAQRMLLGNLAVQAMVGSAGPDDAQTNETRRPDAQPSPADASDVVGGLAGMLAALPMGVWTSAAVRTVGIGIGTLAGASRTAMTTATAAAPGYASDGEPTATATAVDASWQQERRRLQARKARLRQMMQHMEAQEVEMDRVHRRSPGTSILPSDDDTFSIVDAAD